VAKAVRDEENGGKGCTRAVDAPVCQGHERISHDFRTFFSFITACFDFAKQPQFQDNICDERPICLRREWLFFSIANLISQLKFESVLQWRWMLGCTVTSRSFCFFKVQQYGSLCDLFTGLKMDVCYHAVG